MIVVIDEPQKLAPVLVSGSGFGFAVQHESRMHQQFDPLHFSRSLRLALNFLQAQKKILELDTLMCPRCGSSTKIKAFIADLLQVDNITTGLDCSSTAPTSK